MIGVLVDVVVVVVIVVVGVVRRMGTSRFLVDRGGTNSENSPKTTSPGPGAGPSPCPGACSSLSTPALILRHAPSIEEDMAAG